MTSRNKSQVTWDREQRALAKRGGLSLLAVAFDSRTAESKGSAITMTGPVPTKVARRVFAYAMKLWNEYENQPKGDQT